MRRVFCFFRGGHTPMHTSISRTRIFCRWCGRELQYVAPQPPPRDEITTTIKLRRYPTLRTFGRRAPPGAGPSDQHPAPKEPAPEEQPEA